MKSFLNYLYEEEGQLDEAGIRFDDKYEFPKSGHVIFLTGGAGSGKDFVLDKVLLFKGKVLNIDDTQNTMLKFMLKNPKSEMSQQFMRRFGKSPDKIDMRSPEKTVSGLEKTPMTDTERMHHFADAPHDNVVIDFLTGAMTISDPERKPNVVFNITGKSMKSIESYSYFCQYVGYDPKNIHIAWVVSDVLQAISNNKQRSRYVPISILEKTHAGARDTMLTLLTMGHDKLRKIMDGNFFIVFNKKGTKDSVLKKQDPRLPRDPGRKIFDEPEDYSGTVLEKYTAAHVKEPGKPVKEPLFDPDDPTVKKKLNSYLSQVGGIQQ